MECKRSKGRDWTTILQRVNNHKKKDLPIHSTIMLVIYTDEWLTVVVKIPIQYTYE